MRLNEFIFSGLVIYFALIHLVFYAAALNKHSKDLFSKQSGLKYWTHAQ